VSLNRVKDRAKGRHTTRPACCELAAECAGNWRTLSRAEPKLWAERRNRGLEKATKSGVSLLYLGLRVAPLEPRVNAIRVKIDRKSSHGRCELCRRPKQSSEPKHYTASALERRACKPARQSLADLHVPLVRRRFIGLSKRLVWRCRRPADHCQKHIKHKECNGNVVEECRLGQIWPELIGRPKEEGYCEQDCFDDLQSRRPMRRLIDEVGQGDQGKRKCGEKVMRPCGKEPGKCVPNEEHCDTCQRDYTKDHREGSVVPVKTNVHRLLSRTLRKGNIRRAGAP